MKEVVINGIKVHQWKYENTNGDDTGYNDLNKTVLNKFNCEEYSKLNDEEKKEYIEKFVK